MRPLSLSGQLSPKSALFESGKRPLDFHRCIGNDWPHGSKRRFKSEVGSVGSGPEGPGFMFQYTHRYLYL